MNLLEQYIEEIHDVKVVVKEWGEYVLVDLTTTCYGRTERREAVFTNMGAWEQAKSRGYYWG